MENMQNSGRELRRERKGERDRVVREGQNTYRRLLFSFITVMFSFHVAFDE